MVVRAPRKSGPPKTERYSPPKRPCFVASGPYWSITGPPFGPDPGHRIQVGLGICRASRRFASPGMCRLRSGEEALALCAKSATERPGERSRDGCCRCFGVARVFFVLVREMQGMRMGMTPGKKQTEGVAGFKGMPKASSSQHPDAEGHSLPIAPVCVLAFLAWKDRRTRGFFRINNDIMIYCTPTEFATRTPAYAAPISTRTIPI